MTIMILRTTLTVGLLALSTTVRAQDAGIEPPRQVTQPRDVDGRWLPWLGCWQSTTDPAARSRDSRVCIVPGDDRSAARLLTLSGDETLVDETLVPDAAFRQMRDARCSGVRRAEWSKDGRMILVRGTRTCGGESEEVSGILLVARGSWLDIQVSEAGPQTAVDVQRYERVDVPSSLASLLSEDLIARAEAEARTRDEALSITNVIEASARVSERAIEAALYETNARFDINKRALIALDDAGVEEEVIDLMLALSFPERFVVDRLNAPMSPGGLEQIGWALPAEIAYPQWGWSRPYYMWDSRRIRPGFGRLGIGWYDPLTDTYHPGYDVQDGNRGEDRPNNGSPAGPHGAVVANQGYTRVRPGETSTSTSNNTGQNSNRNTPQPSSSESGNSASSSGSSGKESGASSSGYSSGGSGGSGRTAVERE